VNADVLQRARRLGRAYDEAIDSTEPALTVERYGEIREVSAGVATATALPGVKADELLSIRSRNGHGEIQGMAFNVDHSSTGIVLLGEPSAVRAGDEVRRTGRVVDVPVGESVVGRVVDVTGKPLDGRGVIHAEKRLPVERDAPAIMDRDPVTEPLQTGIKVVDALIPIGRGQRELILGDRQTGKTAIALDTVINQRETGVLCFYCAIGKRSSAVAKVVRDLEEYGAMDYTTVIVTTEEDPPGVQFIAAYAACAMAEHFMRQGRDTLVIYDDLTRHARAYRELSLLLRRPPGREAYPGDIFYIHARLLERSTHLRKALSGGSLTALPIIETEAQNLSAYIPTNLISITDGQIYLSPDLFQKGILPAVDVGRSVSRVGGKTQRKAYRAVAGDLRLSYSQFEELEAFARFGTKLDEETRRTLERGRRVREILKQPRYRPLSVFEQIVGLVAVNEGVFEEVELDDVTRVEADILEAAVKRHPELAKKVQSGEKLSDEDIEAIARTARKAAGLQPSDEGESAEGGG
jgi:F-type H+-transporting ATPase subunit alpha